MRYSVKNAKAIDNSRLYLEFEDGRRGIYDMSPLLPQGVFRKLCDPDLFRTVQSDGFTAVWSNGLDIAPEELYEHCTSVDHMDALPWER